MRWGLNQYGLVRIPVKKVCKIYYVRWYYNGWHYWAFLPGRVSMVTEGEEYRTIGTKKISMGSGQITRGQCAAIRTIMNTREVALYTIAGWMNICIEPGTVNIYDNQLNGNEIEFVAVVGSKDISYSDGYSPVGYVPEVPAGTTYCGIVIGTQIWMCYNYASAYPGSKVYNNDEANRALFGGLYTYNQIMSPGFCPAGWHVPTLAEWQTAIAFCGGDAVAGGILKSVGFTYWFTPNTGAVDTYNFGARGGGYCSLGTFADLFTSGYYWTATEINAYSASHLYFRYNMASLASAGFAALKTMFASVRLIKDVTTIIEIHISNSSVGAALVLTLSTIIPNIVVAVNWGDGTSETHNISTTGYSFMHTYGSSPHIITISNAQSIQYIQLQNALITDCETLPAWRNIDLIDLQSNNLTFFIIYKEWFNATMSGIYLSFNALGVDSVNNLLITADNSALTAGTIDLTGGTNAAPTGAGIVAKNSLIVKGLTVNTN